MAWSGFMVPGASFGNQAPAVPPLTAADVWSHASRTLTAGLENLDAAVSTRLPAASYAAPDNAGITTLLSRLSSSRAANLDSLDVPLSVIAAYVDELETRLTGARAAALDLLDVAISTRLAAASYSAPANADIAAIKAKTDALPASPAAQAKIDELHRIAGLDASAPMTVTPTTRVAGAISLEITGDLETTATVTRV